MKFKLDCSIGEGGGSLVRIAVALAAAKNIELELVNIRAKRSNPGLRAQHIEAIKAIVQLSGISVRGLQIGSSFLVTSKSRNKKQEAAVRIGTAGSVSLVIQAVLYYSLLENRGLMLKVEGGATHGKWAPSIEYIEYVTHKLLHQMSKDLKIRINQYGFYPKGGANCEIVYGSHETLSPLNLTERGELEEVKVFSIVSDYLQKRKIAERQFQSFINNTDINVDITPNVRYVKSLCPGTGLTAINRYSTGALKGCFVPGEKQLSAEKVGELCSKMWKDNENSLAVVDKYATDQLIVPIALANGKSEITTNQITNHTKTNISLIQKLTNSNIEINKQKDYYLISAKNA
ncbi:MAG: RNA 3'-terminal phosphate cyclase [Candidatus Thorarchaeota archaeon]